MQLIPLLNPPLDLAPLHLKDSSSMPRRLLPGRLDPVVRLATVAPRGTVSQADVTPFGEDDVVRVDVEVRHARHDLGVRLGVVLRGLAVGEGGGRDEVGVVVAEVLDGGASLVLLGRVCEAHVLFYHIDVLLRGSQLRYSAWMA